MLSDSEVTLLEIPDRFLIFSNAYLDSAILLCSLLALSTKKVTYARGSVVLYLTFHATELFLKGAILSKDSTYQCRSHNIEELHDRYKNFYPGKEYEFEMPFTSSDPNFFGIEPDQVKEIKIAINKLKKENPYDQRYRYPQNRNGVPWDGLAGFELSSFLPELKKLKERFDLLALRF